MCTDCLYRPFELRVHLFYVKSLHNPQVSMNLQSCPPNLLIITVPEASMAIRYFCIIYKWMQLLCFLLKPSVTNLKPSVTNLKQLKTYYSRFRIFLNKLNIQKVKVQCLSVPYYCKNNFCSYRNDDRKRMILMTTFLLLLGVFEAVCAHDILTALN